MKCIKCNHENLENAIFCENCGNPLSNIDTMTQSHSINKIKTGDFCSTCGKPLEKGATFCAECGSQQEIICPKCETTNPVGAMFCQSCAMAFPVICPSCKTENIGGAEFCENCGKPTNSVAQSNTVGKRILIAAASIVLLLGLTFLFTENRVNHHLELAELAFTNQDYSYVTGKIKDAETYAFLSYQKEDIATTHFAIISLQTDKAVSKTKNEEYEKAAEQLKIADQFCTSPKHDDFVNQKYKTCLDMLIEKGNSYTSNNKFKSAKKIYASAELFTKTSSQKDLLADNVSDYKSKKNSYYAKLRQQRQYSSSSSYSSGSGGSCKTFATVEFNSSYSCMIKHSLYVNKVDNYNSIETDQNYHSANIYGDCIKGTYKFSWTFYSQCINFGKPDGPYSFSGTFYLDGQHSYYSVFVSSYDISVRGY